MSNILAPPNITNITSIIGSTKPTAPLYLEDLEHISDPIVPLGVQQKTGPSWIDVPYDAANFEDFNNPGGFLVPALTLDYYQYYIHNNIMCVRFGFAGSLTGPNPTLPAIKVPANQADPLGALLLAFGVGWYKQNGVNAHEIMFLEKTLDWINFWRFAWGVSYPGTAFDFMKGIIHFQI